MIKFILLIGAVLFFALNMGASGIAPSFAAVHGARLISRKRAVFFFSLALFLGAFAFGPRVAKTLSSGIISREFYTFDVALIILLSAGLSLFIANWLRVPQSTSWVTVFAVFGAAVYFQNLNWLTVFRMVGMWLVLPVAAFIVTFLLFRIIYPPGSKNLWFYEKAHLWKNHIHFMALASSCYVAFAIGSNNVANAVGPLAGAGLISMFWGFFLIAPLFGLGGLLIGDRTMKTIGKEIVPLGLITSTLVSFVTASLLIVASALGVPQSLVQLNTAAILAIGTIKHEHVLAMGEKATRKTFLVWFIAPIISAVLSYTLLKTFLGGN